MGDMLDLEDDIAQLLDAVADFYRNGGVADREAIEPDVMKGARRSSVPLPHGGNNVEHPFFVFERAGGLVFVNAAGRRYLQETDPGAPVALSVFATELFERRRTGTLDEVSPPRVGGRPQHVEFSFEHPEGAREPASVALVVRPTDHCGVDWWSTVEPPTLESVLESVGVTPAELEVAKHFWQGRLEKEVSKAIHRSLSTVKYHAGNLYRRCGVSRRSEWMAWVMQRIELR